MDFSPLITAISWIAIVAALIIGLNAVIDNQMREGQARNAQARAEAQLEARYADVLAALADGYDVPAEHPVADHTDTGDRILEVV